jgi:hypothetical protein
MARPPRIFETNHCYHLMSRVAHREFLLSEDERNIFVALLKRLVAFSGLELLAYCVMSNHFHLLIRLSNPPAEINEEEVIRRIGLLDGSTSAAATEGEWRRLRSIGANEAANSELESYIRRMYDVSEFMKMLKQRLTVGFNYRCEDGHSGTLWEGRFKSVAVESSVKAMSLVAAYDDLNPVRGGMVLDPAEYKWCSWSAALKGDEVARKGYRAIYGLKEESWNTVRERHQAVMDSRAPELAKSSRSFVEGGAIGSAEFVAAYIRSTFPENRKNAAPKSLSGGAKVWGELRVAHEKR